MEKKNDDLLNNFNLDAEKIGWYLVCYNRNYWDSLETIKYYEVIDVLHRIISTPAFSSFMTTRRDSRERTITKHLG